MTIFEITVFGITLAPTYYGLMYAIGFMAGYVIIKNRGIIPFDKMDDLFMYMFFGVILGGRLGYVLFYNLSSYLQDPISILKVWEGGMSFHGGVLGVLLAMIIFSKRHKIKFFVLADQIALILPIGLGLGRIGNYLNKELLGFHPYTGFLAVEKNGEMYFPSPLLEAFLEGFVLYFLLLYFYKKKNILMRSKVALTYDEENSKYHGNGQTAALFLILYALFRIIVEAFFRIPDSQIGYIYGYFTMGEILSLPMFIIGIILYFRFSK